MKTNTDARPALYRENAPSQGANRSKRAVADHPVREYRSRGKGTSSRGDRMELHEIRYFLALSQTLNFTRAAEACHITQPALTRAIRKMEDELGALLFSREPNNTHLTDLGRLIEPHLIEIMACAGEVKQAATRFLNLESAGLAARHHEHDRTSAFRVTF